MRQSRRQYYVNRSKQKYVQLNELSYNVSFREEGKDREAVISVYTSEETIEAYMLRVHPTATDVRCELRQSGE
jgi:hypothetical protein